MSSEPLPSAAGTAVDYDPFAAAPLARVVPATEPQREIWLAAKLDREASLAYNEAVTLRFAGALDDAALRGALQALVDRHEALRGTLSPGGDEFLIAEHVDLECPLRDLRGLAPAERDSAVAQTLDRVVREPFDLEHGPLVRAELLRVADDEHVLVLTAHHIVCDGWSFGVVVRDLAALYAQRRGGPAPQPADSFADFALAQAAHTRSAEHDADAAYWLARFAGPAAVLDLPTDRPWLPRRSFASQRIDLALDADLVAAVKRTGATYRASFYATLISAFGVLLHRLAGSDDVVIGIPAAGQAAGGHAALIGHCVNVLPLRIAVAGDAPFADVLARVRGDLLDAFDHQQFTLGELLGQLALPRDPARLPLVNVLFNLDQALDPSTLAFADLAYAFNGVARAFENFEVFVNAVQVDSGLRLECQYNSDLFAAATIEAWLDAYATLLRSIVAEPARACAGLNLLSSSAAARLDALQPAATAYDATRLAHEYFEAQVDLAPQRAAVRHAQTRWSYAELEMRANAIAHTLRARGARRGALVGLCLGRGPDMVAAVLGAMKSGAGYVPLDPAFPLDRLAFMTADASLVALVVDDEPPAGLDVAGTPLLSLHGDADELAAASTTRLPRDEAAAAPDSIAYVIYTSGSTGKPKGVRVPHRTTSNFLTSMQRVPGIVEDDRLVAVTTLSFDIAFMELMLPLSAGAEIIIADRDDARDGVALRALVETSAATMLQATPSGWRILVESGWQGHTGFKAVSGGEPLTLDLAEALLQRCGEVWNGYGPTETTVYSTYWRVDNPHRGIAIGRPIANTTVRVLDAHGAVCPLGVPGELYIGGDGVTLGYLNRPELDAERFTNDPFAAAPGARRYRTGDRGRWLANGAIEHLGRLDFQVKVRGYRIELGEIETNLAALAEVARAAVLAREDRPGDVRLVAYLVAASERTIDESDVRARLKTVLPDYMIPQHVVALDALPLLPNGKLDRGALPAPIAAAPSAGLHRAPRNDIERRIAEAMEATLSLPGIGIDDDFFALGGHSLLAAQLTARLNREFDVALSFRTLFDAPSVLGLSHAIETLQAQPSTPVRAIERRIERTQAPLSRMQERLWLLEELHPGRVVYNTPSAHRLIGALDEEAFGLAFQDMIARQESLRTAIAKSGDDVVQVIHASVPLSLFPAEDLSTLPADAREAELMARLDALTNAPFELTQAPLFRARMFRLGADHHVLFFMPHHIIWDGWSFDIFYEEIAELYDARRNHRAPQLAPLPISYGDFAVWHRDWMGGPEYARQLAYWHGLLRNRPIANVLPTDRPRRPGMSGEGRTEWISIPHETAAAIRELGRRADATPFMVLLALYYALLYRYSGEANLIVGTPVRGRVSTDVEHVMGYFTNLLPLPLDLDPACGFLDLLRQVKALVLDSFANADTQLENLTRELAVKRDGGGTLLYQALFSFQDARQRARRWGGLAHEQIPLFQRGATEDLGLWFLDHGEGMVGGVIYNADILSRETARSLAARYLALVDRAIAQADASVDDLTAADAADLAQIEHWNATAQTFDEHARIEALVAAQADAHGERAALTFGSWDTSYAELDQRANRIAACLRARGAVPGIAIGLASTREPNRLAAMLAILSLGATCVPIDAADPPAHLRSLIELAAVRLLVGDSAMAGELHWPRENALWFDADTAEIAAAPRERVAGDGEWAAAAPTAFVLFTPHASGADRRVELGHRGLVNALTHLQRTFALQAGDRIIASAPPLADRALLEWLLPLSVGATLVAADAHEAGDGAALQRLLGTADATLMIAAPQQWQALLDAGWAGDARLRALCCGGQPAPQLAARLLANCAELWCAFGAAETSLLATCGRIEDAGSVHCGAPIANTTIHILDQHLEPCIAGRIGEICVGGSAVAEPAPGAADDGRFIVAAHPPRAATRLFRSGHRGRWLSDGHVEELGRNDRRVRVRGRWIEPATVENALLERGDIAQAQVLTRDGVGGDGELTAYVVGAAGATPDAATLAAELARRLPASSRPARIVVLDELPTLANGRVDIEALARRERADQSAPSNADDAASMTPAEMLLAEVWRELLGIGEVRAQDNFFDLGGHSLLALSMVAKVEKLTRVRLNLLKIANSNLRALAAELPQAAPGSARSNASSLGERMRGLFGFGRRGGRE